MPDTNLLGLPLLEAAQAQKHVTHNEALDRIDALVQLAVLSRTIATPPATPAEGDRYLVAAGPTGDWTGHAGELAYRSGGIWRFALPKAGWRLWVQAESLLLVFDGTAWAGVGGGGASAMIASATHCSPTCRPQASRAGPLSERVIRKT